VQAKAKGGLGLREWWHVDQLVYQRLDRLDALTMALTPSRLKSKLTPSQQYESLAKVRYASHLPAAVLIYDSGANDANENPVGVE
jgi:hypothetical protein